MTFVKSPTPPAVRKSIPVIDLTGGLDYSTDAFQVDTKYAMAALNVDFLPGGGAALRRTTTPLHTDNLPAKPVTLGYFDRGGLGSQLLVGLETGALRYIIRTDDTGSPSSQIISGGSYKPWRGVQVGSDFYLCDGRTSCRRWDGSTLTTLGTSYNGVTWNPAATYNGGQMPVGRLITAFHNRVWTVVGDDELHFSFPLTLAGGAEDWGSEDFIPIDRGINGRITAIVPASDRLFVFKEHGTYVILGWSPATFQNFPVSSLHGATSPEAVATDGTRLWAWDTKVGLHFISPTSAGGSASDDGAGFRPLFRLIRDRRIAEAEADQISVGHVNDKVYCSMVLDGVRQTLVLDGQTGGWTIYDLQLGDYAYFHPGGRSIPVACSWHPDRPYRVLMLDQEGDTDDAGNAVHDVPSLFTTAWLHDNLPTIAKQWHCADFIMDAGFGQSITAQVSYDWDAGTAVPLGTISSDVRVVGPEFVMDDSEMVGLQYERLSPSADLTPRRWQRTDGSADEMRSANPRTTRRRVRIPALEATSLRCTVFGPTPSKRWSVRAIVLAYTPSERPL